MQSTLSKCLDTPPMAVAHGPKSAVFFDAENVSARLVPAILSYLRGRGDVPVIRAYADFSKSTASSWCALLRHTPITAVQVCHKANPFPYWTSKEDAAESNEEDADSGEDTEGQSIADGTEETEAEEGEEYKPYIEGIVDYVMKDNVHDSGISYGFIKTEGGEEYFFNHDDTWHELQRGDRVQFIAGRPYNAKAASPRERRGRATNVIRYAREDFYTLQEMIASHSV